MSPPDPSAPSGDGGFVSPLARWFVDRLGPGMDCDPTIHPDDAMLRFSEQLHHGVRSAAVLEYFRSGWAAFRAAEQVLDWRFGRSGPRSIADFGCGHGRVSRFFARRYGVERVVAAEADPSGVAFVRRFGIPVLHTPVAPERCDLSNRLAEVSPVVEGAGGVDALFAYSVLTHLPARTFGAWLARFWDALAPGGVLAVSVLDERTLWPGRSMPASGFYFEPISESQVLDEQDYGSTWITEARMRGELGKLVDVARVERLSGGLWRLQDLWIVVKEGRSPGSASAVGSAPADLPALTFDPGPVGYLESVSHSADGRGLTLAGWASDWRSEPVRVDLELDGHRVASAEAVGPRDDLADADPGGQAGGFSLVFRREEPIDPATPMTLVARPAQGDPGADDYPIYRGTIEAAYLLLRVAEARRELEAARSDRAVFEASRFGQARRRWLRLKQRLGAEPAGDQRLARSSR